MSWKLLPLLLLSGCSWQKQLPDVKPVEVVTVVEQAPLYHPPLPNKVTTMPVEWVVLTPQTMGEYLADLEQGNAPTNAFYGLTTKGYKNLSYNMAEVKRYIRQVLSIVEYYRSADTKEGEDENE